MPTEPPASAARTVAVLLCTWRAGASLEQQLDSIAAQDWPIALHVHDDASGDNTAERVHRHPAPHQVQVNSQNLGFVNNFGKAIDQAIAQGFAYIALADQDDIWHQDRISKGMRRLLELEARLGSEHPILVHSDLTVIDAKGRRLKDSFLQYRGYSTGTDRHLPAMLGQCGVLGNTILMNRSMAVLSRPFPSSLHSHDWWLGVLAELSGTRCFVEQPTVDYRLHDSNTSNTLDSLAGRRMASLRRGIAGSLLRGDLRLPFHEDSRRDSLKQLLRDEHRRVLISDADQAVITFFIDYLDLKTPRWNLLLPLLKGGYLKSSLLHRARVTFALLLTRRYESGAGAYELEDSAIRDGSNQLNKQSE